MISDARSRLRDATRQAHERLDTGMNMLDRIADPDRRRDLVQRFHGLHAGAEAVLAPRLADMPALDFEARRRTAILARDLLALGAAPTPPCPVAPLADAAEALGLLYVLEGSTLGGRFIQRETLAQGLDQTGLSFLTPYGEAAGERWRAFLAVLEAHAAGPEATRAMTAGALTGFQYARDWLCEPEPAR